MDAVAAGTEDSGGQQPGNGVPQPVVAKKNALTASAPASTITAAWTPRLLVTGMPLLGLATILLEHRALYVPFTHLAIPSPLPKDVALGKQVEVVHTFVGHAFYWVIGAHVLAALYHHLWRRDDTLRRML